MIDKLKARLAELETVEAQAIHQLGVVAGRLQEIKDLIAQLEAEGSRPVVEHGGIPTETTLQAVKPEKR